MTAFSIGFAVGTIVGGAASSAGLIGATRGATQTAESSVEFASANPVTGFPGGAAKALGHMPSGMAEEDWLGGVWDIGNNPTWTTANPGGGVRAYGVIDDYAVRVVIGRAGKIINAFIDGDI